MECHYRVSQLLQLATCTESGQAKHADCNSQACQRLGLHRSLELPYSWPHRRCISTEPGGNRNKLEKEVEMIRMAHEFDLPTSPYVFNADEAGRKLMLS
ncbi:hypothetical protein C8R48DRAFT_306903 [Suillus tomentosus]|nr:hypothetical protein C8R48DRAFT_306903 [Suillus tomentosus]